MINGRTRRLCYAGWIICSKLVWQYATSPDVPGCMDCWGGKTTHKTRLTRSVRSVGLLTIIETIKKTHSEDDNDEYRVPAEGGMAGDDDDDNDEDDYCNGADSLQQMKLLNLREPFVRKKIEIKNYLLLTPCAKKLSLSVPKFKLFSNYLSGSLTEFWNFKCSEKEI